MPTFQTTAADLSRLPGEDSAWIDLRRGIYYEDGTSIDSFIVSDGDPSEELRKRHMSSDLWIMNRRSASVELAMSLLGSKPQGKLPNGLSQFATHLLYVAEDDMHHFFVLSEPWMPRGDGLRRYRLDEITDTPEPIRQGEDPLIVFFDRINPKLGNPLVDDHFIKTLITARNVYRFASGTQEDFDQALGEALHYFVLRLQYPEIPEDYHFMLSLSAAGAPEPVGALRPSHNSYSYISEVRAAEERAGSSKIRSLGRGLDRAFLAIFKEMGAEITRTGVECDDGHSIYRASWIDSKQPRPFSVKASGAAPSAHTIMALEARFSAFFDQAD